MRISVGVTAALLRMSRARGLHAELVVGCQNSVRAPRNPRFAGRTVNLAPDTRPRPSQWRARSTGEACARRVSYRSPCHCRSSRRPGREHRRYRGRMVALTSPSGTSSLNRERSETQNERSRWGQDRRRVRKSLTAEPGRSDRGGAPGRASACPRPVGGRAHKYPRAVCWRRDDHSPEDADQGVARATQAHLWGAKTRCAR
jgi:hypothetical protein